MIKALLFDIDDTLYDSTMLAEMARRNSVKAMIDSGLPFKDEQELYEKLLHIIKTFGSNYPRHYDELLRYLNIPWNPKIIAAGIVAYEHTKFGYLKPFPGVIPSLIRFRKKFRLGVVSNGIAIKQWEKLIALGLSHFFDVFVTSGEAGVEKPSVEIFTLTAEKFGLDPQECVMIGNKLDVDITGAGNAGMETIWFRREENAYLKHEGKGPDYIIESFFELIPLIEKITQ